MVPKNLLAGQQWRNGHRDHSFVLYGHGEREGDGEMCGKSNMETYIIICKLDSQWNVLYGSGNSNRGSAST